MHLKFRYWSLPNTARNPSDAAVMLDWVCIMQTAFNGKCVAEQHSAESYFEGLAYSILAERNEGQLMLWTGLKDREGTDIYEGDIVNVNSANLQAIGQIKWGQGIAGFFILTPAKGWRMLRQAGQPWNLAGGGPENRRESLVVIGNIYEHPDLLTATP